MTRAVPEDEEGRPEQRFFDDPALDRLYGLTWALATEVYVLRDRVDVLESALAANGSVDLEALRAEATPEELMVRSADRKAFIDGLFVNLTGRQQSKGASS